MPGHKGKTMLGIEKYDITEIDGADILYSAEGIIDESERMASELFKTEHSFYSTEGSTLAIKAMTALVTSASSKKRAKILAARNIHKAFVYAAAWLDFEIDWIYDRDSRHIASCNITAELLSKRLSAYPEADLPDAVYITSPDYLGNIADVKALSAVCHSFSIPLLVDNAHGAYLAFLEKPLHPIALGADMSADSAHKTLPVLTGGAYLHISKNADKKYIENARQMMSAFASTSPSYLILQSLDLCNDYIDDGYREKLKSTVSYLAELKEKLKCRYRADIAESEPLKVVAGLHKYSIGKDKIREILSKNKLEPELLDREYIVFMVTCENRLEDYARLEGFFADMMKYIEEKEGFSKNTAIGKGLYCQANKAEGLSKRKMSPREAILAPHEYVCPEDAVGRTAGAPTVSCPPAIPIAISGEIIDENMAELFKKYGIEKIEVVKENR